MRRLVLLVCAAALVPAAVADAGVRPGAPPPICRGSAFSDQVGTAGADRLASAGPAQRLFGLGGADRLFGSPTRASCLFGGAGDDVLALDAGGGVAWGEEGDDVLFGSLVGDVIQGGAGTDAVVAADGDDKITVRDGRPELILCGAGADIVAADRADALSGCESATLTGAPLRRLAPTPRRIGRSGRVRIRFEVPQAARAGAYRVLLLTPAHGRRCADGPVELARFPKPYAVVRRGQSVRIAVLPPPLGWCPGAARVSVLRDPGDDRPGVPVARFSVNVR